MLNSGKVYIIMLKSFNIDIDKDSILIDDFIDNIGCDMVW